MKTKITLTILSVFLTVAVFAQRKTSVLAANSDISDNLNLKAVASIFGDSKDIADFEYRLNDPNIQISNLDLNNDNMVDYLRVIEMVQNNTHLVVLQAVLQEDVYQDVATIAVSKKKNRQVHIQIIGDPYMYGSNYIYEPIYVVRPSLYSNFWINNYRPYRSYYGWNRYPTFYTSWSPYSYSNYNQNVYVHINQSNYYNYSTNIYNSNANNYYQKYRANGYEQKYPHRDFKHRTSQVNKYDYDRQQGRSPQVANGVRASSVNNATRTNAITRSESAKTTPNANGLRPNATSSTVRQVTNANSTVRPSNSNGVRSVSTSSSVRPATNSTSTLRPPTSNVVRPVSTNSAVRPSTSVSAVRPSTSSSNRSTTEIKTAPQRSSNSNPRTPSVSQYPSNRSSTTSQRTQSTIQSVPQRSSSNSVRSPQHNLGSKTSSSNRSLR